MGELLREGGIESGEIVEESTLISQEIKVDE